MKLQVTRSNHPLMKVTAKAGNWSVTRYLGPFNKEYELTVPEGIDPDEVEVTTEACDGLGKPLQAAVVIKPAKKKPKTPPALKKSVPVEAPSPTQKSKVERRFGKRQEKMAQEERPSDHPLSAGHVVNNERDPE